MKGARGCQTERDRRAGWENGRQLGVRHAWETHLRRGRQEPGWDLRMLVREWFCSGGIWEPLKDFE